MSSPALQLLGVSKTIGVMRVLEDVSLTLRAGEVLGLAGESGSGKTTVARIAAGLLPPSNGRALLHGRDIATLTRRERLAVQLVPQNPHASLNPRLRIATAIGEAPIAHGLIRPSEVETYVDDQLSRVGLEPADKRRFPHQFSGGQRQRISIARALAVRPAVLVCDEAVSALDVSVQAQVLNLFVQLREELGLAYLFISHDLDVLRLVSDRIAVMQRGRIVEEGATEAIFSRPQHAYVQALLADAPRLASNPGGRIRTDPA